MMLEKYLIRFAGFLLKLFMAPKLTGIAVFVMLVCAVVLCGSGCQPSPVATADTRDQPAELLRVDDMGHSLTRYIDYEAGAICYYVSFNYQSIGLSCMPLSETRLDETKGMP
jgi:hypothetical protein